MHCVRWKLRCNPVYFHNAVDKSLILIFCWVLYKLSGLRHSRSTIELGQFAPEGEEKAVMARLNQCPLSRRDRTGIKQQIIVLSFFFSCCWKAARMNEGVGFAGLPRTLLPIWPRSYRRVGLSLIPWLFCLFVLYETCTMRHLERGLNAYFRLLLIYFTPN